MKYEKELKMHLRGDWWMYLLVLVLVPVLWNYVYTVSHSAADNEKLRLTVVADSPDFGHVDAAGLEERLKTDASAYTVQKLREVTVESVFYTDSYMLGMTLYSRTMGLADFFVLTQTALEKSGLSPEGYFACLDEAALTKAIGADVRYYRAGDRVLGICVPDECRFRTYYTGGEACYVFVALETKNAAGLNGAGDPADAAVLDALKYLLETE